MEDFILVGWGSRIWLFHAIWHKPQHTWHPLSQPKQRYLLTARVYALRFFLCFFSILSHLGKLLFWPKNPPGQPTSSGGKHIKSAKPHTFFRHLVRKAAMNGRYTPPYITKEVPFPKHHVLVSYMSLCFIFWVVDITRRSWFVIILCFLKSWFRQGHESVGMTITMRRTEDFDFRIAPLQKHSNTLGQ